MRKRIERVKATKAVAVKAERPRYVAPVKLFGRWESKAEVTDPGIRGYVNLEPRLLPRSTGKFRRTFHKSKAHITERLAVHLMVPGHKGKRHKVSSGHLGGNFYNALATVEAALAIIEQRTKKNPVEVLAKAVENAALREEIISYQLGSIIAREGVVSSPQRRVDKALRFFAQGTFAASFNKKKSAAEALAAEIIGTSEGKESFALRERERIEREAAGAR